MATTEAAPASVVEHARALAPLIRETAGETERARRLPEPVVRAMAEAGIFRMAVPRSLGGLEADPATMMRAIEEVARVDGSAGWCAMIGATSAALSAYLPDSAAREIYGTDPLVVTGGSANPTGVATPVEGGYEVRGRWAYGSGIEHCAWRIANCVVLENGAPRMAAAGISETRMVLVPAAETAVLDTWDVAGLRGTGSHDFTIDGVFVPAERAILVGGGARNGGPLYRFPFFGLLAVGVASAATGIARGAIDALVELAAAKTPAGSRRPLRERAYTQMQIAEAEATLRGGRAFLFEAVNEAWRAATAGEPLTVEHRAVIRLAATHAATCAARATDIAYNLGGATANYATSPLQRFFRDVHAATQHVLVSPSTLETTGRLLLGLESETAML